MSILRYLMICSTVLLATAAHAHESLHGAAGSAGSPATVTRTVELVMSDTMRFAPSGLAVRRGETLRLLARNDGAVMHEIVLGTPADIARHRQAMLRDPAMAHAAANMAHVAPGRRGELVWQFTEVGSVEFACLLPGHYEAGMKGTITVH